MREAARSALGRGDPFEARARVRASLELGDSLAARGLWWQLRQEPLVARRRLGEEVSGVAVSAGGGTVAVTDSARNVHFLDAVTLEPVLVRGLDAPPTHPVFLDGDRVAVGTITGDVAFVDGARRRTTLLSAGDGPAHPRPARVLGLSADRRRVYSFSHDGLLRAWDASSGAALETRALGEVDLAELSPRGDLLAIAAAGELRVEPLAGGPARPLGKHASPAAMTFSPDGALLAVSDGEVVRALEVASGREAFEARLPAGEAVGLSFGPGRLAAGGRSGAIRLLETPPRGEPVVLVTPGTEVRHLAFSPDGRRLVAPGEDGSVRVWDTTVGGSPVAQGIDRGYTGSALGPGGDRFATVTFDGTAQVWDAATGRELARLAGHAGEATSVAFTPDGALLATAGVDGTVRLWDLASGRAARVLHGHGAPVFHVRVSPDGRWLASGGMDGAVRLWGLPGGEAGPVLAGHGRGVSALEISPDGARLASGDMAGAIRLFDLPGGDGRVVHRHGSAVAQLSFSPDGRALASSAYGADREVRLLRVESGESVVVHRRASWQVAHVVFRPDGKLALVDNRLDVIDVAGPPRVVERRPMPTAERPAFTPDGKWILIGPGMLSAETLRPRLVSILLGAAREVHTPAGWARLDPSFTPIAGAGEAWRAAVAAEAEWADVSSDGRLVCVALAGWRGVSLWDRAADRELRRERLPDGETLLRRALVAAPDGCAGVFGATDGRRSEVRLVGPAVTRVLVEGGVAVTADGSELFVATADEILRLDRERRVVDRMPGVAGAWRLVPVGDEVLVATADEGIGTAAPGRPARLHLDIPRATLEHATAGPAGTVALAFIDGHVGLWSLATGERLGGRKLESAVAVAYAGGHLYALTEAGERVAIDASVFERPYCELLAEVWRAVPVAWRDRAPAAEPPPREHACAR
jgi:WD40 repeat protein